MVGRFVLELRPTRVRGRRTPGEPQGRHHPRPARPSPRAPRSVSGSTSLSSSSTPRPSPTLRDIAAAGIRFAVVLAAGFDEIGVAGQALQQEITDLAVQLGVTCARTELPRLHRHPRQGPRRRVRCPRTPGCRVAIAIVSQSGATAHTIFGLRGATEHRRQPRRLDRQRVDGRHHHDGGSPGRGRRGSARSRCSSSRSATRAGSARWHTGGRAGQADRRPQDRFE